jgi:hypothetical protein
VTIRVNLQNTPPSYFIEVFGHPFQPSHSWLHSRKKCYLVVTGEHSSNRTQPGNPPAFDGHILLSHFCRKRNIRRPSFSYGVWSASSLPLLKQCLTSGLPSKIIYSDKFDSADVFASHQIFLWYLYSYWSSLICFFLRYTRTLLSYFTFCELYRLHHIVNGHGRICN